MKVLRIHSWDGPVEGGGEDYVRTVSQMLEAQGHPQRIVAITSRPTDFFGSQGVNFVVPGTGFRRGLGDSMGTAGLLPLLRRTAQDFEPDIIHLHHFDAGFSSIAHFLREVRQPILFTAHDAELVCPISTLVLPDGRICEGGVRIRCGLTGCKVGRGLPLNLWQTRVFDTMVAPRVRGYLCPSRTLRDYLDSNGYRPALHLPSFAMIPPEVRRAGVSGHELNVPRIGFLGRIEENKGIRFLLEAFARVKQAEPKALLDLAGEGTATAQFQAMAQALDIADSITWSGWKKGADKEAWFRNQRLVVFPSLPFENFPLVALEALVRGIPVVATDAGGAKDIVRPGSTGWLVPPSNPTALADAILEALRQPEVAEARAQAGRSMVLTEFTPEVHVERLRKTYEKVLAGEPLVPKV